MYDTISVQTWISVGIAAIILVIGLFLVFSKESEKIIVKTKIKQEKKKPINLSGLDSKEKEVIKLLEKENATRVRYKLIKGATKGR
jgi:hypothetical protein